MVEIWKDIPNYEGYQVSNLGRVRTHNKITFTEKHGKRHWKDRILKYKSTNENAYKTGYRVDLWKNGKPKTFLVARLVAYTFFEKDINDHSLTVNHIDGNRFNNNINNLELITLKENIQHEFRTGLYKKQIKVKITDKTTGTIMYPSSLNEGSKLIYQNPRYLSAKIIENIFENDRYMWELI